MYHYAQVWVNGALCGASADGYGELSVRIDNCTGLRYQPVEEANVVTVRADASYGSGHWYEGGGIFRPVVLVARPRLYLPVCDHNA